MQRIPLSLIYYSDIDLNNTNDLWTSSKLVPISRKSPICLIFSSNQVFDLSCMEMSFLNKYWSPSSLEISVSKIPNDSMNKLDFIKNSIWSTAIFSEPIYETNRFANKSFRVQVSERNVIFIKIQITSPPLDINLRDNKFTQIAINNFECFGRLLHDKPSPPQQIEFTTPAEALSSIGITRDIIPAECYNLSEDRQIDFSRMDEDSVELILALKSTRKSLLESGNYQESLIVLDHTFDVFKIGVEIKKILTEIEAISFNARKQSEHTINSLPWLTGRLTKQKNLRLLIALSYSNSKINDWIDSQMTMKNEDYLPKDDNKGSSNFLPPSIVEKLDESVVRIFDDEVANKRRKESAIAQDKVYNLELKIKKLQEDLSAERSEKNELQTDLDLVKKQMVKEIEKIQSTNLSTDDINQEVVNTSMESTFNDTLNKDSLHNNESSKLSNNNSFEKTVIDPPSEYADKTEMKLLNKDELLNTINTKDESILLFINYLYMEVDLTNRQIYNSANFYIDYFNHQESLGISMSTLFNYLSSNKIDWKNINLFLDFLHSSIIPNVNIFANVEKEIICIPIFNFINYILDTLVLHPQMKRSILKILGSLDYVLFHTNLELDVVITLLDFLYESKMLSKITTLIILSKKSKQIDAITTEYIDWYVNFYNSICSGDIHSRICYSFFETLLEDLNISPYPPFVYNLILSILNYCGQFINENSPWADSKESLINLIIIKSLLPSLTDSKLSENRHIGVEIAKALFRLNKNLFLSLFSSHHEEVPDNLVDVLNEEFNHIDEEEHEDMLNTSMYITSSVHSSPINQGAKRMSYADFKKQQEKLILSAEDRHEEMMEVVSPGDSKKKDESKRGNPEWSYSEYREKEVKGEIRHKRPSVLLPKLIEN